MTDYSTLQPEVIRLCNLIQVHTMLNESFSFEDQEASAALEACITASLRIVTAHAEGILLPADDMRFDMRPDRR